VAAEIRNLIRDMSQANPLWGAPRIHGELRKLGIDVAQSTVAKYLSRPRKPPSQTWRTFLSNHLEQMASIDFFVYRRRHSGFCLCSWCCRMLDAVCCTSR
jgi:hypothetical protein